MTPHEIFRFDKHEGSAGIPAEDDIEDLNRAMIQNEKQPSNLKGKVQPSLSLSLMHVRNNSKLFVVAFFGFHFAGWEMFLKHWVAFEVHEITVELGCINNSWLTS